jgi:hypothetical protein
VFDERGKAGCVRDGIRIAIPQATEWQDIGNQIDAALISRDSAPLPGSNKSLTFCDTSSENPNPMKRCILPLLGIFVAMAFLASCQQEGTTDTTEPATGTTTYMNRPEPPREANQISFDSSR